jgi:hypothetical protein
MYIKKGRSEGFAILCSNCELQVHSIYTHTLEHLANLCSLSWLNFLHSKDSLVQQKLLRYLSEAFFKMIEIAFDLEAKVQRESLV